MGGIAHHASADSPGKGYLGAPGMRPVSSQKQGAWVSITENLDSYYFFPTILKFFYISSTFSLDLCEGQMKKSVFQMCPMACNFFKNSLSGVTVCGLLLFF